MAVNLSAIIDQGAGKETYAALIVEKRILRAGNRVMKLSNVASVAVQSEPGYGRTHWWIIAVTFGIAGVIVLATAGGVGAIFAAIGAFAVVMALRIADRHYLTIQTNDGFRTLFSSNDIEFLVKALDLLACKINDADRETTAGINFEQGSIGSLAPSDETPDQMVEASSDEAGLDGAKPGQAALGRSDHSGDADAGEMVQFGELAERISEIRAVIVRTARFDTAIVDKIDEMLELIGSGAATPAARDRIAAIADEVRVILQAYPSAALIFARVGALFARAG